MPIIFWDRLINLLSGSIQNIDYAINPFNWFRFCNIEAIEK